MSNSAHNSVSKALMKALSDSTLSREGCSLEDSLEEQKWYTGKLIHQRHKVKEFKQNYEALRVQLSEKERLLA